jgi:hypothetical protein
MTTYKVMIMRLDGGIQATLSQIPVLNAAFVWEDEKEPENAMELALFFQVILQDLNAALSAHGLMITNVDALRGALPLYQAQGLINKCMLEERGDRYLASSSIRFHDALKEIVVIDSLVAHCARIGRSTES